MRACSSWLTETAARTPLTVGAPSETVGATPIKTATRDRMSHLPNISILSPPLSTRQSLRPPTSSKAQLERAPASTNAANLKGLRRARPNIAIGNIPGDDRVSGTSTCRLPPGPLYSLALVYNGCPGCRVRWEL